MLFTVSNKNNVSDLPFKNEYDNIISCGENTYILYKNGKIGLCKYEDKQLNMICDCEYDLIDCIGDNLFLSNDTHIFHYNLFSGALNKYLEFEIEPPYIYACNNEYQYIIQQESGKIVYKHKYTDNKMRWFKFCGETEKGPVFYDYHYSDYLYPYGEEYQCYKDTLHHPFIINQENILNVIWSENGLGIIDSFGNTIIDNNYDEITIELCVSGINKNSNIKKIIKLPNSAFNKDTISDIRKW